MGDDDEPRPGQFTPREHAKMAELFYEYLLERRKFYDQAALDIAKWMLLATLAINLAVIAGAREQIDSLSDALVIALGFLFILLSGLCSVINSTLNAHMYGKSAKPAVAVDLQHFKKPKRPRGQRLTMVLSYLFGVLSLGCVVWTVLTVLRHPIIEAGAQG